MVFAELARAYMLLYRYVYSEVQAERVLLVAGPTRDEVVASVLATRGAALPALRREDEGISLLRGAIALADSAGHIDQALRALNNLLSTAQDEMPLSAQLPLEDEAVEIARRYGFAGSAGNAPAIPWRGNSWRASGNAAKRDLDEASEWPIAHGRRALLAASMAALAAANGDETPLVCTSTSATDCSGGRDRTAGQRGRRQQEHR